MEKKSTHIFRKEKGQIVVQGKVNLTDVNGNKIPHGDRFTLCGVAKSKKTSILRWFTQIRRLDLLE